MTIPRNVTLDFEWKRAFRLFACILLVSLVILSVSWHKYYVSTSEVSYSDKEKSLQLVIRVFTDDMDKLFTERYGLDAHLDSSKEPALVEDYLKKYLFEKLNFKVNGMVVKGNFLGKEYDADLMKCYIEYPYIPKIKILEVENSLLQDLFEEQQNIMHFRINEKRTSHLFTIQDNKAVLNF